MLFPKKQKKMKEKTRKKNFFENISGFSLFLNLKGC